MPEMRIIVYGAHSRARTLMEYLTTLHPEISVCAFLVDNNEKNPIEIDGIPVVKIQSEGSDIVTVASCYENEGSVRARELLSTSMPVYIATRGVYHRRIRDALESIGFTEIIPVTPKLDMDLRNAYLKKRFDKEGRVFDKIDDYEYSCVYVAKSIHDRALIAEYIPADYEKLIQVGATLTEVKLQECAYTDDAGENISDKNKQFCELTAMYWIWKNARQRIVGLAHYRRHFILPNDWMMRMELYGIDVILPTPLCVMPGLGENYCERHNRDDYAYLMQYCEKHLSDEYSRIRSFFEDNLYSPCNMFIMRKEALDAYCEWVFPILFDMAEHIGQKDDGYQNRYPGFMAERLLSYYFESRRGQYKVVFADKNFLE